MPEHLIVHVEDDAPQWLPIMSSLRTAIGEHLSQSAPQVFGTLKHERLTVANAFPAHTKILWDDGGTQHYVHYWLLNTVGVEQIADQLEGKNDNLTFVLDVMRKKNNAGLQSVLPDTLDSIRKYVKDESKQVRLFTAYSEKNDVEFPKNHPILFKKGLETQALLNYLLMRIGFGRR